MAKVKSDRVAWISPETLQHEERERVVKAHRGDADTLLEKLDRVAALPGKYVQVKDAEEHPEAGLTTRIEGGVAIDEYEEQRLVCVGQGEYEVYDPEKHGEPYSPLAAELRSAEPRSVEK